MIVVENVYCHDGCCEDTGKHKPNTESGNKVIIGGYILFVIVLGALVWYENSIGIYIDVSLI